jgi:hypothetical protein
MGTLPSDRAGNDGVRHANGGGVNESGTNYFKCHLKTSMFARVSCLNFLLPILLTPQAACGIVLADERELEAKQ